MPLSEPVAVGLIGCGWIAELAHIPTLERNAALVAVAEADAARRTWVRGRLPGVRVFDEGMELLDAAAVHAVVIALPTAHAAPMARAAFRAGKHVYVEKPGARSAAEWQLVVDDWRRSGSVGIVGYNFRHNPIYLDAIRRVQQGELGKVIAVQTRFVWAADRVEGWRATTAAGGGVLLDLASHHIDLAGRLLADDAVTVRCTTRSMRVEEDTASLSIEFGGATTAQILVSSAGGANENRLTVVGSEGVLDVDLLEARPGPVRRRPGRMERAHRSWIALQGLHPARLLRSPGREPSFDASLVGFLDAVANGDRARPDPADGLRVLRVVDAARASAPQGGATVAVSGGPEAKKTGVSAP